MERARIPLAGYESELSDEEIGKRAEQFRAHMATRRSVRDFSRRPVPDAVIEDCVRAAASAPSGANQQPWHFVVVSDPRMKRRLRDSAEVAEHKFYGHDGPRRWQDTLTPMGTGPSKPFLEDASHLVVVFTQRHGLEPDGSKRTHYYPRASVGLAAGILVAAVHCAGLACLTYTPSKTRFLNELLERPDNEEPFIVLAVGHPAPNATVPDLKRKSLEEIMTFV